MPARARAGGAMRGMAAARAGQRKKQGGGGKGPGNDAAIRKAMGRGDTPASGSGGMPGTAGTQELTMAELKEMETIGDHGDETDQDSVADDESEEEVEQHQAYVDAAQEEAEWERSHQGVPIETLLKHLYFRRLSSQLYGDFLKYIPFLVMFSFFFLGIPGTDAFRDVTSQYYVVGTIKDKLMGNFFPSQHVAKFYVDTANAADWFTWATEVMVPNVWRCFPSEYERKYQFLTAQGQNYLLGALRYRTLSVKKDSCSPNDIAFESTDDVPCYAEWGSSAEQTAPLYGFPDPVKYAMWKDLVAPVVESADAVHLAEFIVYGQKGRMDLSQAQEPSNPWGSNKSPDTPFGVDPKFATDGDRNTTWVDFDQGALVIPLPVSETVQGYTFTLGDGPASRDPLQWRFEGSVTGGDADYEWFLLDERTWDYNPEGDCLEGPCDARRSTQPVFNTRAPYNSTRFRYVRFVPTAFFEEHDGSYDVNWAPQRWREDGGGDADQAECNTGVGCPFQIGEIRFRSARTVSSNAIAYPMDGGKFVGAVGVGAVAWEEGTPKPQGNPPTPPPQNDLILGNGTWSPTTDSSKYYSVGYPAETQGPEAAVDGFLDTPWVNVQGRPLLIEFPEMVTLKQVTWATSADRQWRDPEGWTLEGTNDDPESGSAEWRLLWDVAGNHSAVPLRRGVQLPWDHVNPDSLLFKSYRFTVTRTRGYPPDEDLLYRHRSCAGLTADELSGFVAGEISIYHCGGHEVLVPFNATCDEAMRAAWALGSNNYPFIDNIGTRFIVVEFFVYTPQVNAFTSVKLFSEEASCGGWINKWQIRSFSVFTDRQISQAIFDFFFLAFVLYFLARYFLDWRRDVKHNRKKCWNYPLEVWNIMELGNLVTFIVVFIFKYIWWGYSKKAEDVRFPFAPEYPRELDKLLNLYTAQVFANAINTVITFLKFLKYVRLNSKLNLLTRTISRAKEQLMSTLVLFLYFIFSYTLSAYALYGSQLGEFRNIEFAMSALSRMLLGDFDYDGMRAENRVLTAFFFWSYVLLTFFIMLQFLIAILGFNFAAVSGDANNEVPFQEQLTRTYVTVKRALHPARIKKGLTLWFQGNARADVLDRCMDNITEHWRLLRQCTDCGNPVSCVCGADTVDSAIHVKEHCGDCGATTMCIGGYHPAYYSSIDSRLIYRDELPYYIGPEEYRLLSDGCNFIDDLWDEVMWDYVCELRFDPHSQKEEMEGFVEKCVREYFIGSDGKALGALAELDAMEIKFRGFELQVQNLLSLLQSERTADQARPKSKQS
eukprot:Hpha_TRINITY_DN16501_c2_g9::TRINITY_DN16501_c2_g9_i1::g.137209::m.137209